MIDAMMYEIGRFLAGIVIFLSIFGIIVGYVFITEWLEKKVQKKNKV